MSSIEEEDSLNRRRALPRPRPLARPPHPRRPRPRPLRPRRLHLLRLTRPRRRRDHRFRATTLLLRVVDRLRLRRFRLTPVEQLLRTLPGKNLTFLIFLI